MNEPTPLPDVTLVAVTGPEAKAITLRTPGPITIGRSAHHLLSLNDSRVSRDHAVLTWSGEGLDEEMPAGWRIADSGSRHGTWLNGLRLTPGRPLPIRPGDRIAIPPWMFLVSSGDELGRLEPNIATIAEIPHSTVSRIDSQIVEMLAQERLALLLRCADAIHSARDERSLAEAIVDAAVTGTGFANVALLRAGDSLDELAMIATRGQVVTPDASARLSRTLLQQAAAGTPARLVCRDEAASVAVSIVELSIQEALCIPILLEGGVAGFLYLDNRGANSGRHGDDAAGFAVGLSRLAALAWANLQRMEAERRTARMEAELQAAGRMQNLLMPPREGAFGSFKYLGESKPGRIVGGDFFDVIPLGDDRLAVAVGDVSGKGVEAAVLMTAAQGFLHAELLDHGDPGRAITELNRFVFARSPAGKFVTLWVAVLDRKENTMQAVDAGHGHAYLVARDGTLSAIPIPKSFPVSVTDEASYATHRVPLPADGRLLVLSDGLLEECAEGLPGESSRERRARQFSTAGVQKCFQQLPPGGDEVDALFAAVRHHAGSMELADDATAVLIRW